MNRRLSIFLLFAILCAAAASLGCPSASDQTAAGERRPAADAKIEDTSEAPESNPVKVAHVIVALCDNEHQGIVPVSAALGNGLDPDRNLYWGAAYGVRTFFRKSSEWQEVESKGDQKSDILERVVFRHQGDGTLLVADAYRGDRIRAALVDYLASVSGSLRSGVDVEGTKIGIYGGADLVAFVGHNGLMDFKIEEAFPAKDDKQRDAIILACASKPYFRDKLRDAGANPLLWTTNLMAPEAYILHDALEAWIGNGSDTDVRARAAAAYSKYQKISLRTATDLLVTGE